ncbi:MAG TPA: C40 family peptidase [Clostridia bacterium]
MNTKKIIMIAVLTAIIQIILIGCAGKNTDESVNNSVYSIGNVIKKVVVNDSLVDAFSEPDIRSVRLSQALFNQLLPVVDEKEGWLLVNMPDGYTGWIKSKSVEPDSRGTDATFYKNRIMITSKKKNIESAVKGGGIIKEVVMGTELFVVDNAQDAYKVSLPGGRTGWVTISGTILLPAKGCVPKTTASDLLSTALKFSGTVYLSGGISSLGMDSPGLSYMSCRVNGLDIPKDPKRQFKEAGKPIEKNDKLIEGDLLFFSENEDHKDITGVGVYKGGDEFLHASKSSGSVEVDSLKDDYYKRRFVGARRLF